jgi:hypothetical protein
MRTNVVGGEVVVVEFATYFHRIYELCHYAVSTVFFSFFLFFLFFFFSGWGRISH